MSPVVFLDLDGVVIDPVGDQHVDRRFPGVVDRLLHLCSETGARIVLSSDRRCDGKQNMLQLLGVELQEHLHKEWGTPVCGHRSDEIRTWLVRHGNILEKTLPFVIIDDFEGHYRNVPLEIKHRLVLCDSKVGFSDDKLEEALMKISQPLAGPSGPAKAV